MATDVAASRKSGAAAASSFATDDFAHDGDEQLDEDFLDYLAECRASQQLIDTLDKEASRARVSVAAALPIGRADSTSIGGSGTRTRMSVGPSSRLSQREARALEQRRQSTFRSFIISANNPASPALAPPDGPDVTKTSDEPAPGSVMLTVALAGVVTACTCNPDKPLPSAVTSSQLAHTARMAGVSAAALKGLLQMEETIRNLRIGIASASKQPGFAASRSEWLRAASLSAVAVCAQNFVDTVTQWATHTQTELAAKRQIAGPNPGHHDRPPVGHEAGDAACGSPTQATATHTSTWESDPFDGDTDAGVMSDVAEATKARLSALMSRVELRGNSTTTAHRRGEAASTSSEQCSDQSVLAVVLQVGSELCPLVNLAEESLQTALREVSRTPSDLLAEMANGARAAGNAAAARLLTSLTLASLWPYLEAVLVGTCTSSVRDTTVGGDEESLGELLPQVLPAQLRRMSEESQAVAADSALGLTPRLLSVAYLRAAAVSVHCNKPQLPDPTAAAVDDDHVPDPFNADHNLVGRYGAEPVPPVESEQLQLISSDSVATVTGGSYVVLSTAALQPGFVVSPYPGATLGRVSESERRGAALFQQVADAIAVASAGDDLAGPSPPPSAPASPVRRSGAPDDADAVGDDAASGFASMLSVEIDSVTSLPSWIATHLAAPLQKLLALVQFEEYKGVVANAQRPQHVARGLSMRDRALEPGLFAVAELMDVAALGADVERLTTRLVDPLITATTSWWLAQVNTASAAVLKSFVADMLAGVPFGDHVVLHVKPSQAEAELLRLEPHRQALACFRALRLRFVGLDHAAKAFDGKFMVHERDAAANVNDGATRDTRSASWHTDPRMSAGASVNVSLAYTVRMLELAWKALCTRQRREYHERHPNIEVCTVHTLRFVLDAVRRFILYDLRSICSEFKVRCRDRVATVSGLREAYAEFSTDVGHAVFASQDTRDIFRKLETLIAVALEVCASLRDGSFRRRDAATISTRLKRAVDGLCQAVRAAPSYESKADHLIRALTFNGFFTHGVTM